jgi:hypothetical protein
MRLNYMTHSKTKPNHIQLPKRRRRTTVLGISALIFVVAACGPATSEDETAAEPQFLSAAAESEQRSSRGGLAESDNSDPTAALGRIQQEANRIAGLTVPEISAQSIIQDSIDSGIAGLTVPRIEHKTNHELLALVYPAAPNTYRVMPETAAGVDQLKDFNTSSENVDSEHEAERFEQLRTQTTVEDVEHEVERIRQLADSTVG